MHYNTSYANLPRDEADDKAIDDIRQYLTARQWGALMCTVGAASPTELAENGEAANVTSITVDTIKEVNFALGFMGVTGRPFHAFCRRYALIAYREWMASGDDVVQTDEQGFRV